MLKRVHILFLTIYVIRSMTESDLTLYLHHVEVVLYYCDGITFYLLSTVFCLSAWSDHYQKIAQS